ncbi:MAG: M20/M25/M40 family metallo-hydrolase, partial [Bacteroidota bacterium]|nr:M20/M25/M40 family metallo-hydrolase [Bacteroidota bacterium]
LTNSKAYENLRVLTKTIGPRLAGSANMVKSEQWGAQAMKVAGADNVWMQECMVPHWDRGGKDEAFALYGKNKKSLSVVALGNSFGSMKAIQAPVILVNNFEELESKKDSIKGKIVFYNYKFKPTFVKTFQGYGDAVRYRSQGASRAAKYGAIGVVVRSISHSTDNFPHTGSLSYNDSFAKIPAVAIGLQDADWLSDKLKSERINVSIHTHGKFFPDAKGHNVIGELKGSEFPDEYITVGGHLDSWDNCEGAHDDGAGCVQTIEIIRAFKALGYQPKRTIRFVLFANEENGLRGGNKYADEAKAKNEKHLFALESDAGGFTPRGFGFTASADQFAKIKTWEPLLAPYGACELSIGGGGADIGPLNRALGTAVAGLQPDSQRYFDYHHAANDTFEAVNKRELELGAVNMAALIYLVDKYGL